MDKSDNPLAAHEADFANACFKCNEQRENCERFFKYKGCFHAQTPSDGFCAECLPNYLERKQKNLEHAQKIIADLPVCFATKIAPKQVGLQIINSTGNRYLLKHLPYINRDKFEGFFVDINSNDTFIIDALDLGPQQHYMFNIKQYCPQAGKPLLPALIIALSKTHDSFEATRTSHMSITNETMQVDFNPHDRYQFTLQLNGECILNSELTLQVQSFQ